MLSITNMLLFDISMRSVQLTRTFNIQTEKRVGKRINEKLDIHSNYIRLKIKRRKCDYNKSSDEENKEMKLHNAGEISDIANACNSTTKPREL